jgi:hypothetical protein
MAAIQPDREARPPTQPGWVDGATAGTLLLLLVAVGALLAGRRWGFCPATYGSAGLVGLSALCPAWEHHLIGAWWVGQSAVSIAMFAGSAIQRSRASAVDHSRRHDELLPSHAYRPRSLQVRDDDGKGSVIQRALRTFPASSTPSTTDADRFTGKPLR